MSTITVLSGPAGVGKGTILERVLSRMPELEIGVSWTTREARPGDVGGVKKYKYVTRAEFMAAVERGEFVEWNEYADNLYGHTSEKRSRTSSSRSRSKALRMSLGAIQTHYSSVSCLPVGALKPNSRQLHCVCTAVVLMTKSLSTDGWQQRRSRWKQSERIGLTSWSTPISIRLRPKSSRSSKPTSMPPNTITRMGRPPERYSGIT